MGNSTAPAIKRVLGIPCGILETVDTHLCRIEFYRHVTTLNNVRENQANPVLWKI